MWLRGLKPERRITRATGLRLRLRGKALNEHCDSISRRKQSRPSAHQLPFSVHACAGNWWEAAQERKAHKDKGLEKSCSGFPIEGPPVGFRLIIEDLEPNQGKYRGGSILCQAISVHFGSPVKTNAPLHAEIANRLPFWIIFYPLPPARSSIHPSSSSRPRLSLAEVKIIGTSRAAFSSTASISARLRARWLPESLSVLVKTTR